VLQMATLPSPMEVPPSPRAGGWALVLPWTSAHLVPLRMVAALYPKLIFRHSVADLRRGSIRPAVTHSNSL
jgi:hypothetical protein